MDNVSPISEPPISPRLRRVVGALLLVSLVCNVTALLIPFMMLRVGFSATPYRLTNSVVMMWEQGLYVLAVLVVGFSVMFPFAKLATLAVVCSRPTFTPTSRRWLAWVERLGKWSMLDVFLVCIILTLTADQVFVGTRPLAGIVVFTVAILLSMLAGELLQHAAAGDEPGTRTTADADWRGWWWLGLAGLALLGALLFPFLRINDWKLDDRDYSVVTLCWTLLKEGGVFPALVSAAFLVVAPLAAWWSTAAWWRRSCRGREGRVGVVRWLGVLRRWSMLDVFGLALAIFAMEGGYLMATEVRWGALFLAVLLALQRAMQNVIERRLSA